MLRVITGCGFKMPDALAYELDAVRWLPAQAMAWQETGKGNASRACLGKNVAPARQRLRHMRRQPFAAVYTGHARQAG